MSHSIFPVKPLNQVKTHKTLQHERFLFIIWTRQNSVVLSDVTTLERSGQIYPHSSCVERSLGKVVVNLSLLVPHHGNSLQCLVATVGAEDLHGVVGDPGARDTALNSLWYYSYCRLTAPPTTQCHLRAFDKFTSYTSP